MGNIPPISSYSSSFPSPNTLLQELSHLMDEWRNALKQWNAHPPGISILQLEGVLQRMKAFLEKNKKELYSLGKAKGWPENGPKGYATFFEGTIDAINNFMFRPNSASLVFGNEQITELHWLLSNKST